MSGTAIHAEGRFAGRGGLELFRQSWRPAGNARAVLANIHGLGDHSGLYPALVDYMTGRNMAVHSFDLRGNGRSPGARGFVRDWADYRDDLLRFVDTVRRDEPGLPLFLIGNSLGGLIALDYRDAPLRSERCGRRLHPARRPRRSRPAARPRTRALPGLARLFARDRYGSLGTRERSVRRRADSGRPALPPPWHRAALHRGHRAPSRGSRRALLPLPCHCSCSTEPTTAWCRRPGAARSPARAGSSDKRLIEYPGAYHALFADFGREQVLADVGAWIEARLPGPTRAGRDTELASIVVMKPLIRALRLRCPHCGGRPIFVTWSRLLPNCPVCGLGFERGEQGYWLGAYFFNLMAVETVFSIWIPGVPLPHLAHTPVGHSSRLPPWC